MPRLRYCAVCKQPFVAKSPNGKYCPQCRNTANKVRKADTEKRLREARKADNPTPRMATSDNQEQIQKCLNCRRLGCPGWCEEIGKSL